MGDQSEQNNRPGFFRDLLDRRFPQILFIYMGVCWTILEFVSWIVEHYSISDHLTDLSFIILISMIPTVGMLAFFHGRPGRDQWTRTEKIGIPVNILFTGLLVFFLFGGKELGSATTEINVVTESGKKITRKIPNMSLTRRVAIFYFENKTGDDNLDWLQYGLMAGCHYDLNQDPIFSVYSGYDNIIHQQVSRAGIGDDIGIPMSLERKIAQEIEREYFLDGSFTLSKDTLVVSTWLYETNRGQLIAKHNYHSPDVFILIDAITNQLKADLELPDWHTASVQDLPAAAILTESREAFRQYITASNLINLKNDYRAAQQHLESAIQTDPTFAAAHYSLYRLYINLNKYDQAIASIDAAMQYIYKFPEALQFALKEEYYLISEEPEKRLAVINMWVTLYPDDIRSHFRRADEYLKSFEIDSAISEYNIILKIDPARRYYLRYIGNAYLQKGDFKRALEYFDQYQNAFPKDYRSFVSYGDLYLTMGQYAQSRKYYTDALMLEPNDIYINVMMARVMRRLGEYDSAYALLQRAENFAKTPREKQQVLSDLEKYYRQRGEIRKAYEYMQRELVETRKYMQPLDVIVHQLNEQTFDLYPALGKTDEGLSQLKSYQEKIPVPWSRMLSLGYLQIYRANEDTTNIKKTIAAVEAALRIFNEGARRHIVHNARGRLHEIQENYLSAIIEYQQESQYIPTDATVMIRIARCYRKMAEPEKAKRLLENVLAILPMHPEAHFELGQIYCTEGDFASARKHLDIVMHAWQNADREFFPATAARDLYKRLVSPL